MISIGKQLTILPSVDSSNNYAMARVRAGLATDGEAWFALEQTAGRGQRSRRWHAEPGQNIMLSIALQPRWLQVSQQFLLSAAVSLACRDLFAAHAGDETKIKWPNDIYWRDRKAGGILIENILRTPLEGAGPEEGSNESAGRVKDSGPGAVAWPWSVIGIGININQTGFPEGSGKPVSLKQITGKEWDLVELVQELCTEIGRRCHQLEEAPLLPPEYNRCLYKCGETTRLKKGNRIFSARINGVSSSGQLLVTTSLEEAFAFGEIEWVAE